MLLLSWVIRITNFFQMQKQRTTSAAQLIGSFVFTLHIVQSLFFINPKFQASSVTVQSSFLSDLVQNREDPFVHDTALIVGTVKLGLSNVHEKKHA